MNTKQMINEIRRGKKVAENISAYADKYMDLSYQYAMHRMALQYYTLYESLQEARVSAEAEPILADLHDCVKSMVAGDGSLTVEKVAAIRSNIIARMRVLTAYTDILQIYEYILNRVEPRFVDEIKNFSDIQGFVSRLYQYIYAVQDNVVINERIKEVIGQLPVRMTKAKFFEYISNSIDLYKKADEEALESFLYMMRSCSMLDRPEGMDHFFDHYRELAETLSAVQYDQITKEEFEHISGNLEDAAEEIRVIIDLYLAVQEIINDLYIVSLADSSGMPQKSSTILDTLKRIVSTLNEMFLSGSDQEIPDELTGRLSITEGRQESLLTECNLLEAAYDEVCANNHQLIEESGKAGAFEMFPVIARLMSSSVFAELADPQLSVAVTPESLAKAKETLIGEYKTLFEKNTKMVNRAVMAAALGKMPVVFNTIQELQDYMAISLTQCRDENERKAAMNLLDSIMEDV